tara:strand:- start:4530 stop:4976 length:447 start_codon:yes stop_codon:yes gene_type:complete
MGDYARGIVTQGGEHYRVERQDLAPTIQHVEKIRGMHDLATKGTNPNGWQHIGSVPEVVLIDWLNKHGYKMDEFARNDGGTRCAPGADPVAHAALDGGVRSKFLRYFLSRDFSKLHNQHVTTKRESSQIVVPAYYGSKNNGTIDKAGP